MTIAELCLPLLVVLTIATIVPAKLDGRGEYDNANPRDPGFYRPGLRARALGAHQNGFEAFPFFAAAVILAEMRGVPQGTADGLALAFLACRILYVALYLGNQATARSLTWWAGFLCNLALFLAPAWAGR
ncbi:MAG TPA: MAPEG family protein [Rhodopila sp.]|uniref:MAPEG family protein n=1 Tax=Rhodopila sp. TaxID=2480087 RepID=UPI002D0CE85F|nr:MAPEG family protein [Rhodopila sp.]HVY16064.1 MAPEG family protein [Rhodopila sp.]